MGQAEHDSSRRQEPFSLTVDQYGRLWLHTRQQGVEVAIDLAEKGVAFQIMATAMAEQDYRHEPAKAQYDGEADNDDELSG